MWKLREYDKGVEELLLKQGTKRLLARLVAQRDINPDSLLSFLECRYSDISHPYSLPNMEQASNLFLKVAVAGGRILVFGDYDCDGVLSSVMLKEACSLLGLQCKVILPTRQNEGYGLNEKSVTTLKNIIPDYKPDLLIVVDCGSSNNKEIQQIRKAGCPKIIVIDHHIIDESKQSNSADVLVNWHLGDGDEMCACGEVYQFIRSMRIKTKKIDPLWFLAYAAIGTVGDVMPLIGDNRIIVRNGLSDFALNKVLGHGLNALISKSKIYTEGLSQSDIQFKIVPKINAAGRMADPIVAYHLFIEQDLLKAEKLADELGSLNEYRKDLQKCIEKESIEEVINHPDSYKHGILLFNPKWHIGVLGIVAARISDRFKKPVLIIGEQDGILKGSGRSYSDISINDIMKRCEDIFVGYGGHSQAVGATLKPDKLDIAAAAFNEACHSYYKEFNIDEPIEYYDAEVRPETVSIDTAEMLYNGLYPYCNRINTDPIFLLTNVRAKNIDIFEGSGWKILSFYVEKDGKEIPLQMKIFSGKWGYELQDMLVDIYFQFPHSYKPDMYGKFQLNVIDIVVNKKL